MKGTELMAENSYGWEFNEKIVFSDVINYLNRLVACYFRVFRAHLLVDFKPIDAADKLLQECQGIMLFFATWISKY